MRLNVQLCLTLYGVDQEQRHNLYMGTLPKVDDDMCIARIAGDNKHEKQSSLLHVACVDGAAHCRKCNLRVNAGVLEHPRCTTAPMQPLQGMLDIDVDPGIWVCQEPTS